MELQTIRGSPPAERLVGVRRRGRQKLRAAGQVEGLSVPLKREELARKPGQKGISGRRVRKEDRQQPDLGLRARVDPGAEARRQELGPEAGAEEGSPGPDHFRDEALLPDEPGLVGLV